MHWLHARVPALAPDDQFLMSPADHSPDPLRAEADALCMDPRWSGLLRRHWPGFFENPGRRPLSTRIHPRDQMLQHSINHHRDANAAVSQYFNVALQQHFAARQILDALFVPADDPVEVLDFACGFGRLIRFLSSGDRQVHIAACEIQPEALGFVAEEFGVPTLTSSLSPESFQPGRQFDFIWVASLFSHLPADLFQRWLRRLHALLSPRGVLCFSVHDEVLVPPGDAMPISGLLFKPQSENADLDAQAYGTTYVTEAYVRTAIDGLAAGGLPCHRVRKGLAHEQDIYVVAARSDRDLRPLGQFRRGPWGWVDGRRSDSSGLVLSGWAASLDDGALPSVSVRINGVLHECPTGQARPDVQNAFSDPRLAHAGWSFQLPWHDQDAEHWVEVTAHSARGECALLYAGLPGGRKQLPAAPQGSHVYQRQIDMTQRSSLSVLASLIQPGTRVLDLGTGSGVLGRHLKSAQACRVDGVTLSAQEQATASAWYERLERLDLEDANWPGRFAGQRYDFIVCADVLEHLREPERVVQACRQMLQPGGWLLVSIPNVAYAGMTASLMHGEWPAGTEGLLDRTHLHFYTRQSFTRMLVQEGWRVDRVEAIDLPWHHTEFWTPFDHLPPAVARYLLAQADASAYQLVFAAQPIDASPDTLKAKVPAPDATVNVAAFVATLYGGGPDSSDVLRGIHVLGRIGSEQQTLTFNIPSEWRDTARLRLDPADRPGLMRLHRMALRDSEGRLLWHWASATEGAAGLRAMPHQGLSFGQAPQAGYVQMLLTDDDPQMDLPVPAQALAGNGPWQLEVDCGWPQSADYLALLGRQAPLPAQEAPVEIVLPVYGGLDVLGRCLSSLFAAKCRTPWHLTLINDASPQPEVGPWLRELALKHPEITVLSNARNLGFVGTVNLGMRLAGRRDVVLLNSDTEVANDWLDRLHRAAWAEPRVGTVTPFSNNATICSHPRFCEDNPMPSGHTTASLDRLFARANAGRTLGIPTGVGFCMYIRRGCLDEVGDFDAETFGAGYGEENDFCVRASAQGWQHLHALDVFVFHAGAASFSEGRHELQRTALAAIRRLHPHYEAMVQSFVQQDPARPYREAVLKLGAVATP